MYQFGTGLALRSGMIRNVLITIYVFVILAISATARAEYNILPVPNEPSATNLFKGELAISVDGVPYLVVNEDQVFELKSSKELSSFNGRLVLIKGFEYKHRVQPIEMLVTDPLLDDQHSQKAIPVLIVSDIKEISE